MDDLSRLGEVAFDSTALIEMHRKSRETFLQLALAKLEIYVCVLSIYEFLSSLAYYGVADVRRVLELLKKLYHIVPIDDDILVKASEIDADLTRKGLFMNQIDLIVATMAIQRRLTLVTSRAEAYEPFKSYGLKVMDTVSFLSMLEKYLRSMKLI